VKLAETGGARVIPLIYNEPEEILFQVYSDDFALMDSVHYVAFFNH